MRASAAALPLRRYWKPPSRWTVLWLLMVADGLSQIAWSVVTIRLNAWNAAGLAMWILAFPYYWNNYKEARRNDAEQGDALPNYGLPERVWWGIALMLAAVSVSEWVLLLAFGKTHV